MGGRWWAWTAALGLTLLVALTAGCGQTLAQRQALRATRYATTDTTILVAITKAFADSRYRVAELRETEVVAQIVYYRDNGTALRRETGDLTPNLPFGQGADRVYGVVMVASLGGVVDARRVEFRPYVWLYRPSTIPMPLDADDQQRPTWLEGHVDQLHRHLRERLRPYVIAEPPAGAPAVPAG